ncbi:hypothetical protein EDB85DRAFT_2283959 [Lactarius pseudohatsudake]|nr:hypothetical protein EDB85DRAFT_2283959 [Lactarius pseudohatsudake]
MLCETHRARRRDHRNGARGRVGGVPPIFLADTLPPSLRRHRGTCCLVGLRYTPGGGGYSPTWHRHLGVVGSPMGRKKYGENRLEWWKRGSGRRTGKTEGTELDEFELRQVPAWSSITDAGRNKKTLPTLEPPDPTNQRDSKLKRTLSYYAHSPIFCRVQCRTPSLNYATTSEVQVPHKGNQCTDIPLPCHPPPPFIDATGPSTVTSLQVPPTTIATTTRGVTQADQAARATMTTQRRRQGVGKEDGRYSANAATSPVAVVTAACSVRFAEHSGRAPTTITTTVAEAFVNSLSL